MQALVRNTQFKGKTLSMAQAGTQQPKSNHIKSNHKQKDQQIKLGGGVQGAVYWAPPKAVTEAAAAGMAQRNINCYLPGTTHSMTTHLYHTRIHIYIRYMHTIYICACMYKHIKITYKLLKTNAQKARLS